MKYQKYNKRMKKWVLYDFVKNRFKRVKIKKIKPKEPYKGISKCRRLK